MLICSVVQCMGKQYSGAHTMLQTIVFLGNCSEADKENIARKYCQQIRGEIKLFHMEYSEGMDLDTLCINGGCRPINMVLSEDMQTVVYNGEHRKTVTVVDGKFVISGR